MGSNRFRAAGENYAPGVELADLVFSHVKGADFTVHTHFPHAAGNELGVLGTEIENKDFLGVNIGAHRGSWVWRL